MALAAPRSRAWRSRSNPVMAGRCGVWPAKSGFQFQAPRSCVSQPAGWPTMQVAVEFGKHMVGLFAGRLPPSGSRSAGRDGVVAHGRSPWTLQRSARRKPGDVQRLSGIGCPLSVWAGGGVPPQTVAGIPNGLAAENRLRAFLRTDRARCARGEVVALEFVRLRLVAGDGRIRSDDLSRPCVVRRHRCQRSNTQSQQQREAAHEAQDMQGGLRRAVRPAWSRSREARDRNLELSPGRPRR